MAYLPKTPVAPSPLGRYRLLSPHASIRVSPIQLGAMSIGTAWGQVMGPMDRESSFRLLDAYYELGGNFIDTASNYQDGTSESIIGEWMELKGNRDELVIATKFTSPWKRNDSSVRQKIHYTGNGHKSLHIAVEGSLKKLRTSYIDILYCHWYDWETSIEELMNSLHSLVIAGKVLYLGASDFPAWVVARANQWAIDHGKTPFCIYQGEWSLTKRSFEREIIPMARELGLALAPWGVLDSGRLGTETEEKARQKATDKRQGYENWDQTEDQRKVSIALEKVAQEVGAKSIQAVAIAYHLQKMPYVFPVIGMRKVEKLQKNIDALTITLSPEQMKFLESALPFDPGFPNWLIGDGTAPVGALAACAEVDFWPKPEAIKPLPKQSSPSQD